MRSAGPLFLVLPLAGCVAYPPAQEAPRTSEVQRVMVYPSNGQSEAQLDRDRYECHLWAVRESGFDPSRPGVPAEDQVRVEPAAGANTAVGAIFGAILGSAVGGPRDGGAATVAGALIGAAVGNSADQAAAQQRAAVAEDQRGSSESYRRAVSACLSGRGYTVK
ncbi:MAG: glycine zipper 2TM domain-containing protein [Steroidobacteraceae bacterium]